MSVHDRTLHVDRNASGRGHAASLEEVVARLLSDDYRTIVLHCDAAADDEYGVVAYLAGTWPQFLRTITVRSIARDGACATWNAVSGKFEREPGSVLPYSGRARATPRSTRQSSRDAAAL